MPELGLLIERLVKNDVEFVVVGGLAVMLYGVDLLTKDVDVCVPFTTENLNRIEAAVRDLHPYHRMTPQRMPFVLKPNFEKGLRNLYLGTDLGTIDLLGEVLGLGGYAHVQQNSVPVAMPYGTYQLVALENLIKAKEAMDREKDRAAVRLLRGTRDVAQRGKPLSES